MEEIETSSIKRRCEASKVASSEEATLACSSALLCCPSAATTVDYISNQ